VSTPTLQTTLTVVNITDDLVTALFGLCETYVPGLPNRYRGLRPIASADETGQAILVPCVMIQPVRQEPSMRTTGKMTKWYVFDFYFVVGQDTVDATVTDAASAAEIFVKLFSNNALGDGSNQFMTYPGQWVQSEMSKVEYSVPLVLGRPNGPKYFALGQFQLKVETFAVA
jgi:hypothetical protein